MAIKEKKDEGAQFIKYFDPLLDTLRGLGGSAKVEEAVDRVADDLKVADDVLNETLPSGGLTVQKSSGMGTLLPCTRRADRFIKAWRVAPD